jgi:hypothetical protein
LARKTPKKSAMAPRRTKAGRPLGRRPGDWPGPLLELLAAGHTVAAAAEAVGIVRATVYARRNSDAGFCAAFDDAMTESAEVLEAEARRRAVDGVAKYVTYRGELVLVGEDADGHVCLPFHLVDGRLEPNPACVRSRPLVQHAYSDTLLIFLLKGRNLEVFGRKVRVRDDPTPRTPAEGADAAAALLARIERRLGIVA